MYYNELHSDWKEAYKNEDKKFIYKIFLKNVF